MMLRPFFYPATPLDQEDPTKFASAKSQDSITPACAPGGRDRLVFASRLHPEQARPRHLQDLLTGVFDRDNLQTCFRHGLQIAGAPIVRSWGR